MTQSVKPEQIFKLRDEEGLRKFQELTNNSNKLKKCFKETMDLEKACNRWYKEIDRIIHQCFRKIKIRSVPPKKTTDYILHQAFTKLQILKEKNISAHMK